jgi:hypothetical protein
MGLDVARTEIYVTGVKRVCFRQDEADHCQQVGEVPTAYRARSSMFGPDLKRLYVEVSGRGKPDTKLESPIYEVE